MPEHEAAGLSAMRGSGARGNPNRAYRRYTAIPLIDYVVWGAQAQVQCPMGVSPFELNQPGCLGALPPRP